MPHKLLPGTQTRRDLFPRRLPAMMTDGDRRLVSSPRVGSRAGYVYVRGLPDEAVPFVQSSRLYVGSTKHVI